MVSGEGNSGDAPEVLGSQGDTKELEEAAHEAAELARANLFRRMELQRARRRWRTEKLLASVRLMFAR
jgi:hypothetical protein